MRVLLIEDDVLLAKATRIGLEQAQFVVDVVHTRKDVEGFLAAYDYDVILLDLGLPDGDGMNVLKKLRQQRSMIPVIILTARDQVQDRIDGLQAGADDFVIKPYDLYEVIARVDAVTRRAFGRVQQELLHGDLVVNCYSRQVSLQGTPITLTSREFLILQFLLDRRGQVVSRGQIENALYQYADEISSNSVEVHIHHLRKKLGKALIRTIHAVGYTIDKLGTTE